MTFKFEHGQTAADAVTGFEGVITGRADYITGCNQYLLQPQKKKTDGDVIESRWFDEDRLAVKAKLPLVTLPSRALASKPGADKPAPRK